MSEIIDVAYREVIDLDQLSTETLTEQANTIYAQAETVAAVSLQLVAEAGKRLLIIKERVGRGNWEDWKKSKLSFSPRKAEQMMKLAQKMDDEGSVFSNPQALADIGISKVWALLSAPEEVAEDVIDLPGAGEMSLRELQAEIRKSKLEAEALRDAGAHDKGEIERLKKLKADLENRLQRMEQEAAAAPDAGALEEEKKGLKVELALAKQELKQYKKKVREEADKQRRAAEEKAQKKAEAETRKKLAEQEERIRKEEADKRTGLEKEVEKLNKMADTAVVEFKIRADALQEDFAACCRAIRSAHEESGEKMKAALKVLLERMEEQL